MPDEGQGKNAKVLLIDIETRPGLGYIWGLFDQNVGLSQLAEPVEMISFAAKWLGQKSFEFRSVHHDSKEIMVERAWTLLDEADAVMGWNSRSFDVKHLNREFVEAGHPPPSPFKHLDLMLTARKKFRLLSNKLQHVSVLLGGTGKVQHEGFSLWLRCMQNDNAAWNEMRRYNIQDVRILEDLYYKLRPWIDGHLNLNLYVGEGQHRCPKCRSSDLQKRGWAYTQTARFQQYCCSDCGGWSRAGKRDLGSDLRESL